MNSTLWPTLESIPGLIACSESWRARLASHFDCLSSFFRHHPPSVIHHADSSDSDLLQLDAAMLGRALCAALGLASKTAGFPLPGTAQIGAWSADVVPTILTIQSDPREFRLVVAELAARLRQPFILFAPTSAHLDAACQELLANVGAAFFALESHILLTRQGMLQSVRPPGEIFARFRPEPNEPMDDNEARRSFAIIQNLEAASRRRAPSVLTVFRLYCMEEVSTERIAKRCRCSKTTVMERLNLIRARTGVNPEHLRSLSPQFEKMEDDLADSRARGVDRRVAAHGGEANGE